MGEQQDHQFLAKVAEKTISKCGWLTEYPAKVTLGLCLQYWLCKRGSQRDGQPIYYPSLPLNVIQQVAAL